MSIVAENLVDTPTRLGVYWVGRKEAKMADWIVVNIGCIECGVDSYLVGRYETEDAAKAVVSHCEQHLEWKEGGQNAYVAWPLPEGYGTREEFTGTAWTRERVYE